MEEEEKDRGIIYCVSADADTRFMPEYGEVMWKYVLL